MCRSCECMLCILVHRNGREWFARDFVSEYELRWANIFVLYACEKKNGKFRKSKENFLLRRKHFGYNKMYFKNDFEQNLNSVLMLTVPLMWYSIREISSKTQYFANRYIDAVCDDGRPQHSNVSKKEKKKSPPFYHIKHTRGSTLVL